jgi:hypothetical protein
VFITMTANPRHPDMLADPELHLADGTLNMDIVIRIFAKQIEELKTDIRDRKILSEHDLGDGVSEKRAPSRAHGGDTRPRSKYHLYFLCKKNFVAG